MVAIIGILVAVSIPIFTGQLEKARLATCEANRRSLKADLAATYMTDEDPAAVEKEYNNVIEDYTCPDQGTITYTLDEETGVITMYCSEHDPDPSSSTISIGNSGTKVTIDNDIAINTPEAGSTINVLNKNEIYVCDGVYYYITTEYTSSKGTAYNATLLNNLVTLSGATNLSISTIATDASTRVKAGTLFKENGTLYVVITASYKPPSVSPGNFKVLGTVNN